MSEREMTIKIREIKAGDTLARPEGEEWRSYWIAEEDAKLVPGKSGFWSARVKFMPDGGSDVRFWVNPDATITVLRKVP